MIIIVIVVIIMEHWTTTIMMIVNNMITIYNNYNSPYNNHENKGETENSHFNVNCRTFQDTLLPIPQWYKYMILVGM